MPGQPADKSYEDSKSQVCMGQSLGSLWLWSVEGRVDFHSCAVFVPSREGSEISSESCVSEPFFRLMCFQA